MTEHEKTIEYYKTATSQHGQGPWPKPRFIPKRVEIKNTVRSDFSAFFPGPHPKVEPGIYEVKCNKWGAVCVSTPLGDLGLKLDEFDIIEMADNPAASDGR